MHVRKSRGDDNTKTQNLSGHAEEWSCHLYSGFSVCMPFLCILDPYQLSQLSALLSNLKSSVKNGQNLLAFASQCLHQEGRPDRYWLIS